MKNFRKAITLLVTGGFFLCCALLVGFTGAPAAGSYRRRVKSGVTVNGVSVGGLDCATAETLVREEIAKSLPPLTVQTPKGEVTFCYPQLSFTDDLPVLLKRAKRNETLQARVIRQWAGAEAEIERLCADNAVTPKNADVVFSAKGFRYLKERTGRSCDYEKSLAQALDALKEGKTRTRLVCRAETPAITEETLRRRTQLLASYTTYFDASKTNRVHNLRLASQRVTGTVIPPHGTFSFNGVVGKRTEANGFREAAVIFDGEFVQGVGGGVCQVSTTLFNAALLSGLSVAESRAHSLSVSYVKPSLDAMVSEYSDLKFENPFETSVYLAVIVSGNAVKACVYGLDTGVKYRTESVVLSRIAPPPEKIVEGEENALLRAEKAGVRSECYRLTYAPSGELIARELVRRDAYAVVQGVRQVKKKAEEGEISQEIEENFQNQE